MPFSPRSGVHCPRCGTTVLLSLAAQLQSEQLGVACDCPECGHQWVYRIDNGSLDDATHLVGAELHLSSSAPQRPVMTVETTIFIVEDDDAVRDALDGLMRAQGWQTRLYISAEEFQEQCRPTCPGCLLLDVHLPGMSGLVLLSKLHQTGCPIPVILMTESLDEHILRQSQDAGAFAFFPKPFNVTAFVDGIRLALEQSTAKSTRSNGSTRSNLGGFI